MNTSLQYYCTQELGSARRRSKDVNLSQKKYLVSYLNVINRFINLLIDFFITFFNDLEIQNSFRPSNKIDSKQILFIFLTAVKNFDKLFEDDKIRRRAKSCYRSEKIFDRKDDSPVPVIPHSSSSGSRSGSQPRQPPSGVTSYRVVERSCGTAMLERIARRAVKKSVR